MYVLRLIATAGNGSTKIIGDRHALIVLVREDSTEKAEKAALEGLRQNCWEYAELQEIAPLEPKLGLSQAVEEAVNDAATHGFSLIVFNDPIPRH